MSPVPNAPQDSLEKWLYDLLNAYSWEYPQVTDYVTTKGRVFVSGVPRMTCPEPDITAFRNYPHHLPRRQRDWRLLTPILAVEVVSEGDPAKDLERNVELYCQVPTIREYWILDHRPDPDRPSLTVYRRRGQRWQKPIVIPFGGTYATRLLPGFKLVVDPQ